MLSNILHFGIGTFTVSQLLSTALTLVICMVAANMLLSMLGSALKKTKLDAALSSFLLSVLKVALYFIVIMTCADKLGIPVSSLLAIVSVATLSLSLAAQGVLANVFGGVILLITKPFKAGEYVEINGVAGSVSKMGLSYTEIVTVDNRRIVIPNSEMSTSKISNYSCEETRRVDVDFATAYTASTEEVKKAVAAAAAQIPTVLQDPAPVVLLNQFADGGIKYQVRVYCPNAKYWDTYFALTEAVRKGLTEAGIGMSYSHVNVHVEK